MRDIAQRMFTLFQGCGIAHGTYREEDRIPGRQKTEIKKTARTLREGPTIEMWEQHLRGERPLGIIPITVDGRCHWGAIDVDKYDLSHTEIAKKLATMGLPLVVCRSKSGGAHLFIFLDTPVAASDVLTKLREIAAALGFGESEVFPKQVELLLDRRDLGNWLNMPYFNMDHTQRYAVDESGKGLSIDKFLSIAEGKRLQLKDFLALKPIIASTDSDLSEGPPCLQHLASIKVAEGGRNNALFAYGVLAKKKFPDQWEKMLEEWNHRFFSPPLSSQEVSLIIRSLKKKDYTYRCKDQPLCLHCDAQTCRARQFGVGPGGASPGISSISILDTTPPLFFVCLTSGGTLECVADHLLNSNAFQRAALEQLRILLPLFKQDVWLPKIQECLEQAVIIEAPTEVGVKGAFAELLEQFCTDRHRAQEKDEILLGKPWVADEEGRYYFRLSDLMSYLDRNRFKDYGRTQVSSRIKELGGGHHFFNLKGRGVNVWWLPTNIFTPQTKSHDIPKMKDTPI